MGVRINNQGRNRVALAVFGLAFLFLGGCAGTVDTLTSQRFREHPFRTMFSSDDPVWVLENMPEGDSRAKAMLELKEPNRRGGNDEEQKKVMQIIAASATSDKQVVCRLSAIETLARFEDPQAAKLLVSAYHSAGIEAPKDNEPTGVVQAGRKVRQPFAPVSSFTPDQVIMIQSRALEALGKKQSQEGLELLCDVAARAPNKEIKQAAFDPLAPSELGQDSFELRLAAIRALANYKNNMHVAEVLYRIMTTERGDIAPRSRAHESLKKVTGKDFPPDSPEWRRFIPINESSPSRADGDRSKLNFENLNKPANP